MKKSLLFCLAFVFAASGLMANNLTASEYGTTPGKEEKKKKVTAVDESSRTFHVAKCAEENKVFLMIGKKPNTKVTVKVYDKNGSLLYSDRINANKDFSTILNLQAIEGATIKVSDNSGIKKEYNI